MMRRTVSHLGLMLCIALLSVMVSGAQPAWTQPVAAQSLEQPPVDQPMAPAYVPGQLLLRFQAGVTEEEIEAFYQEYGLSEMEDLGQQARKQPADDAETGENATALKLAFATVEVTQSLLDTLARDARVIYAEPNYILQVAQEEPNDPDFDKLWNLNNTGQTGGTAGADVSALDGWSVTTGSEDVAVVVIDTGVDYTHEDLGDNMWVNEEECPEGFGECEADGVDDDNNGYVDDFYGINAVTDSGDPMDDFGHGTHVAGTVGAQGDNGIGVVGVNQEVSIVACKFLSASGGGTVADAVKCFNYVDYLKNERGVNVVATNNSWGGGSPSQALEEAMAGEDQPLHICAAGNANSDVPNYPAAFDLPNIVSVAGTDHNDLYADFSNYGPTVDLAAPGDDILSTVPTEACPLCDPTGYALIGGTSMATPHVAGAVALIAAQYPELTLEQIKQRIMTGVDPLSDDSKTTVTDGRLNLFNTLEEDETPPAAVGDLAVTSLMLTQVELTWTATGDDGMDGTANGYDVRYATEPISEENWDASTEATGEPQPQDPGATETFTVEGLEPETTYYFAMRVVDNVGNVSPLSNVVIGTTSTGSIVFTDDMESGENDWTAAGTDDLWHLSEHRSNSPTHAWYYGDEETRTYDTGGANSGTLTSPSIDLPTIDDVLLTFHEWSELENSSTFDRTRVQLSVDGGSTWETVFESHGTDDAWLERAVNLTPYIQDSNTIQIRFWFDTIDDRFNGFEGWYVDDVQVLVAEPTAPGAGPSLPNLAMLDSNIGLSQPEPVEGDELSVNAVVLNDGGEDTGDVRVQFMEQVGDETVPFGDPQVLANIPAGGSATAQIPYDTTDHVGEHTLEVVVDPLNLISESNESDNRAQRTFTVTMAAAPNLVMDMSNITFNPPTAEPGDQVTVHAIVRNDGALNAESVGVQVLDVTDSDAVTPVGAPQIIEFLGPGETAAVEVTYDTTGVTDERDIRVVVDPQNSIAETNEEDNEAEATLALVERLQPNLSLNSRHVAFVPAMPSTGESVTVVATIFNEGAVAAEDVVVQFTDVTNGDAPIGDPQTIARIPPGGSGLVQVAYPTEGLAGDRRIEITVDPRNFIDETRETDNDVRTTLSIQPPPIANLTVSADNIGFHPSAPVQGTEVAVRAVIRNTGGEPAEDISVQFQDVTDGAILPIGDARTLDSIDPGASATVSVTYPTTDMVGQRRIQVVVDPGNFVRESNEQDNRATQTLSVIAPDAPNLSIMASNVIFDPPKPTAGDEVAITAVVMNNGGVTAEDVLVQFVDVSHGGFVPIGTEQTIDEIGPGDSATAQVTYDTTGRAGSRRIRLLVDSNNLIDETDENDNEALATLSITPVSLPNLVVDESRIGFSPSTPTAGETVSVTVAVQNHGDAAADEVEVQLLDISDGEPVPVGETITVSSIAAGGAAVVSMRYDTETDGESASQLAPRDRILRVAVDPNNFVEETDETDNRATARLALTPAAAPDLVVHSSNLGFSPASPVEGEAVTLTMTLLNAGGATAEDVLVQFVDVTDGGAEPIGAKQTIAAIGPGSSATARVTYTTTEKAGDRRIRVVADPHSTVEETEETNNETVALLHVSPRPQPNLVALSDNVGFSDAMPAPGEPVTVTATILNRGDVDVENVVVQFVDATGGGATPISANQVISAIPAGGAATAQIVYPTAGRFGERTIQVVVDPNNLVVESNENDNEAMASLSVQTPPSTNLVLRSSQVGFDPPVIGQEGSVAIFATVRNDGDEPAGSVLVQFLDVTAGGSTPIGEPQSLPGIGAGASGMVQADYDVPPGTDDREIQVIVDPNNTILESDESDNEATVTLERSETAQANLRLTTDNVTFAPMDPVEGETVTIRATIFNNGAVDAQDVEVQFSDTTGESAMAIGPQQTIPAIPAGSSATVEVSYSTQGKAGMRSIRVAVDPNNFIGESSETDNTATVSLDVHPPDRSDLVLVAGNVTFNPSTPTAGDTVTVRAVVLNHGAREANDVVVQFMDVTDGIQQPIGSPQTIARIVPGGAATVQMVYPTTGLLGERLLEVVADPNNFIVESDENNNTVTKPLVVSAPPTPNLVMLASNVEFEPVEPQDGDLVTIRAAVLNNGEDGAMDIVVRIEDVTDPTAPVLIEKPRLIDRIEPGESEVAQVTYDTTEKAGARQIRVTADPADTIAESDENDNQALAPLEVAPPPAPNLAIDSGDIRFTPMSPVAGDMVTATVTVHNEGQRNANLVEVQFLDVTNGGEAPIGNVQLISGIPVGGAGMAQVTYDTTGKEGDRTIRVVVDPADLISETDEEDNQAEAELTVAPPTTEPEEMPNLVIGSGDIVYTPTMPIPGDTVELIINVSNDGDDDASNVVVRVMDTTEDEPEQVGEDQSISELPAGETVSVTVAYETEGLSGDRTLEATVDPDDDIAESNEADNSATVTIPLNGDNGDGDNGEDGGDENGDEEDEPGDGDDSDEDTPGEADPSEPPDEPESPDESESNTSLNGSSSRTPAAEDSPEVSVQTAEDAIR